MRWTASRLREGELARFAPLRSAVESLRRDCLAATTIARELLDRYQAIQQGHPPFNEEVVESIASSEAYYQSQTGTTQESVARYLSEAERMKEKGDMTGYWRFRFNALATSSSYQDKRALLVELQPVEIFVREGGDELAGWLSAVLGFKGSLFRQIGEFELSLASFKESVIVARKKNGVGSRYNFQMVKGCAEIQVQLGELVSAKETFTEYWDAFLIKHGDEHPHTSLVAIEQVHFLFLASEIDAARELMQRAEVWLEKASEEIRAHVESRFVELRLSLQ